MRGDRTLDMYSTVTDPGEGGGGGGRQRSPRAHPTRNLAIKIILTLSYFY